MKIEKLHYDNVELRKEAREVFVILNGHNKGSSYSSEEMARWAGCNTVTCSRGGCEKHTSRGLVLCESCRADDAKDNWNKAEKQLDTDVMLYSDLLDVYFDNIGHAEEELNYLNTEDDSSLTLYDLRLYLCKPNYIGEIDPEDLVVDIAPEDMYADELMSDELWEAIDSLNTIIASHKPVSYSDSDIAFDVEKYFSLTD